jgi:3-deoxy-D-manno-octulosonic-acid transferase
VSALVLGLWRGAAGSLAPFVDLLLRYRLARGKEQAGRSAERWGFAPTPRPAGRLVWLHAASVGESVSILPLVERLLAARADLNVLVTTGTVTSAELMTKRLPPRALHQFVPVDVPAAVDRFLAHWRPDLAIWVESELWPVMLGALARDGVPAVLVNGRMSDRSFRRWRYAPWLIAPMLAAFAEVLAQSEADADRFRRLGAAQVSVPGNLKLSAPPLEADIARLDRMRALIGGRPRWLLASSHPGEEAIAGEVHRQLATRHPDLLTIVVPRHPERGTEVVRALANSGLTVARRAAGEELTPETEIYVADTLGELGLWYRIAPVVAVGGSFVRHGGHNPLEPARLDCAILLGPDMRNFAELERGLRGAAACLTLRDGAALAREVERLLFREPAARDQLARNAATWVAAADRVLDRVTAAIEPRLLPPKP